METQSVETDAAELVKSNPDSFVLEDPQMPEIDVQIEFLQT